MNKPKIIIKEVPNSIVGETDDVCACITIASERINLDVEYFLESLILNWDENKIQSYTYINSLIRWEKIAKANGFDFEIEANVQPKDTLITL